MLLLEQILFSACPQNNTFAKTPSHIADFQANQPAITKQKALKKQ
jgi:hypothetical protein